MLAASHLFLERTGRGLAVPGVGSLAHPSGNDWQGAAESWAVDWLPPQRQHLCLTSGWGARSPCRLGTYNAILSPLFFPVCPPLPEVSASFSFSHRTCFCRFSSFFSSASRVLFLFLLLFFLVFLMFFLLFFFSLSLSCSSLCLSFALVA